MATSVIPKRSTRLNSQDPSVRITPVRKLRSRQISVTAKDSQTTDVNVKNKRLYVTSKNISTKKHAVNKTNKNTEPTRVITSEMSNKGKKKTSKTALSPRSNKTMKLEKPEKSNKDKKKTYRNTSLTEPNKIIKPEKPDKNKKKTDINKKSSVISNTLSKDQHKKFTKKGEIHNNSRSMRQMSLKESISRQTEAKVLHLYQHKEEVNDNVKLVRQYLTRQRWNSVVVLQDLVDKKVPVYKTAETSEAFTANKNDIYDFKFDANDTKEKLTKKKRKRNINKTKDKVIKRTVHKRATRKKTVIESKTTKNEECDTNLKIVQDDAPFVPEVTPLVIESGKEDIPEKTEELAMSPVQAVKETTIIDNISAEKIKKHDITKPRIISIENANNIIITKQFNNSKDSQPFRPTNVLDNKTIVQHQKAVNCSLLTKSWSPIWKTVDTFDPGSPWRPPPFPTLSYGKHFAQSTPNMNKSTHKKNIIHAKNDSHNCEKIINVTDAKLKNIESSVQSTDKINHMKKNSNLQTRKFGTEITNTENFSNSSTAQSNVETMEEKPMLQMEIKPVLDIQPVTTIIEAFNCSSVDNIADKENATRNYQTPKLLTRKKLKKRHLSNFSPSKTCGIKSNTQKENADPQPGPSGIKSLSNFNEKKVLSELNLNKLENIRIKMEYNIIDDAHSTPINSNETKIIVKPMTDLENDFGFCEKESDVDISPIENKFLNNPVQVEAQPTYIKKSAARPARLSLRDIKNCLIQKKDNRTNKKEIIDQSNIEDSKPLVAQKDPNIVDVINFSDTFDVLSESEKLSNCETEIPLFMDLEPSHFLKVFIINIILISYRLYYDNSL